MARFRPVSKFKSYTNQAFCDFAKGITAALTGNPTFPTPPVTVVDQGTHNDALQNAILAWGSIDNRGSHAIHLMLLDARRVVEEQLRSLAGYVDGIAAGDATIVVSSGF